MKNSKKFLIIALALILVVPMVLSSCNNATGTDTSVADTSSTESEDDTFFEETGLERKNWGGKTVKFLGLGGDTGYYNREIAPTQVDADEYSGEALYEAVCERARQIEENFGITVEYYYCNTDTTPAAQIALESKGGTSDYDIVADTLLRINTNAGLTNNLYDVSDLGIDLTKDFWDQTAISDLSIAGHLFCLTGDIVVSDDQSTWCCFFNKTLISEYGLENPYQLVTDKAWTIDKLYAMAKVYSEQNVNASDVTWENGHYGLVSQTYDGITSMAGFNERMIEKDANDYPIINFTSASLNTKFDTVYNVLNDKYTTILAERIDNWQNNPYEKANRIFFENRALFQYQKVQYVLDLASNNVNFGIVPMPKYDENQEYYNTTCTVYWSLFVGVPKNVDASRLELIGYTLQLMGYYGKKIVTPAYYETTIKSQKTQDQESEDMLDLIFSHRVYDIAASLNFASAIQVYTSVLGSGSNTLASYVDSVSGGIQASIDDTIEALNAING